jgi:hypothetical protein
MSGKLTLLILLLVLPLTVFTQTKAKKPVKKPVKKPAAVKAEPAAAAATETDPAKKNERPAGAAGTAADAKKTNRPAESKAAVKPSYPFFYEFTQPAFFINRMTIEHDDTGKGTITFTKRDFDEAITDPVQFSPATMQKLKTWWGNLNFLDSSESYQAERDFAHMGTIKLRLKRDKRERTAEFNWTDNKDAKALMDEYRNLGQQYIWIFDITLSRENQPLESPKLMENFEAMLKRNEISDPQQMIPLLKDLSEDERIPLIARNRAAKILQQIEKDKK